MLIFHEDYYKVNMHCNKRADQKKDLLLIIATHN